MRFQQLKIINRQVRQQVFSTSVHPRRNLSIPRSSSFQQAAKLEHSPYQFGTRSRNWSITLRFQQQYYSVSQQSYFTSTTPAAATVLAATMAEPKVPLSQNDPSSFSNPESVKSDALHLHWNVDFDRKIVYGTVTHHLIRTNMEVQEVILDARELHIKSVKLLKTSTPLEYQLGESVLTFGQPLTVKLPKSEETKTAIVIEYETTGKCSALQWLNKEQTAGKKHPYMFSQCQAIHARSLFPCQDTPSVKATYTAEVIADAELTVLMSAVRGTHAESCEDLASNITVDEHRLQRKAHKFVQKIAIPSYLVAIVVGKLGKKEIGPRTTVWSEQEFVEAAAFDFSETENMLQAAEKLMGEYVWGIYDILVLPPSFPFGGMENPCLTFATPTLLSGDKSLANVIAHEIAHSWTGNLVTNKTFEDFWLNEGFTVYTERRILGVLKGEAFRQFEAIGGWNQLKEVIGTLGATSQLTRLVPDLKGIDPDDAFSSVPYEKGFAFLYYLETLVGGPDVFQTFLRKYIETFKLTSLDTTCFKNYFTKYFEEAGKGQLIASIDWNTWLFAPGMPPFVPKYDTSLAEACTFLKSRWVQWNPATEPSSFSKKDLEAFTMPSSQLEQFLTEILEVEGGIGLEKVKAMETAYQLSIAKNNEIKFRWIRLCLKEKWMEQLPLALEFVTEQGRMKYIRPVYRDLYTWEEVREKAIETFKKNRPNMMYVSAYTVAKDLKLEC